MAIEAPDIEMVRPGGLVLRESEQTVAMVNASVKRIRNGRAASEHLYFDQLEFLQQIGALSPIGQ